jgi:hypothetical protein
MFTNDVADALRTARILGVRAGAELPVRARLVRSGRMRQAVTAAYGAKYTTKASRKWVEGFSKPARELATLEFVPR